LFLGISIPQYFVMNTAPDGHGPVRTNGGWVSHLLSLFNQDIIIVIIWILDEANRTLDDLILILPRSLFISPFCHSHIY